MANQSQREAIKKEIVSYMDKEGFSDADKNKFLADHFNNVPNGKLGSAADYLASGSVLKQFGEKVGTLEQFGDKLSAEQRNKILDNYSSKDLTEIIGNAGDQLGRAVTEDDLYNAFKAKDFSGSAVGLASRFTRQYQRELGLSQLRSETGDSISEDDIKRYSDIDKISDSDFLKEYRTQSQNFTPGQKWLDSAKSLGKTILGEDPSETDLIGFARKLASGEYNEQELASVFKMDPKYGMNQDKARRETLSQEFTGLNKQFLDQAGQQIQGQFMAQGRGNSSAATAQLAQVAQNLGQGQQQFLQGIAGQQLQQTGQREYQGYLQNQASAFGNYDAYRQYVAQQQQMAGAQRQGYMGQSYALQGEQRQRGYQIQDFNMQQNAYDSYLRQNRSQAFQNNMFQLAGAGVGAYGSFLGRPQQQQKPPWSF